ncbi:MAG TPA: hypothetical protein VML53_07365 [Thermoplasmata archaeon]|nr:hypothetical protein [Thermoplasmata archaeon]
MARIRRGSGVREQDLVGRAKALRERVDALLPKLTADCPRDRFDRLREELEEVRASADDQGRLDRFAKRGDELARAYAGLLRYALDPTPPVVVSFPVPDGEVSFVALARTSREAEVAVQQSEDPTRLLLGYADWARKGFHFFATHRTLWCTGRSPAPPPEFLAERIQELPYRLTDDAGRHRLDCVHLAANEPRPYLEVGWPGAGRSFRVCRRCAKADRHLLSSLSDGAIVPDPSTEFAVSAALNVRCQGGPECVHAHLPELPRGLLKRYELGRFSDGQLLDAYLAELKPRIERPGRPTFVAGGVCYGDRLPAFLDALGGTPVERRALEEVLAAEPGYFEVDEPSASRALERLWAGHAEEIVGAIVPEPDEARRLVEEARGAPGRVAEILKRAQRRNEEREVLGALPRYRELAREADWVDRIAREHRTRGDGAAERAIVQALPREGKERGLAYGLLLALGRANAHAWQFSPTEREFGQSLEPRAKELFGAPAAGYHGALARLLESAGVVDWGTRETSGTAPDRAGSQP